MWNLYSSKRQQANERVIKPVWYPQIKNIKDIYRRG
jgi:hypothetical protein